MPAAPAPPRITQPGLVRFETWCEAYEYYIDSIFNNVQAFLMESTCNGNPGTADATYDWRKMHVLLRAYLYSCSSNRYKSYRMYV